MHVERFSQEFCRIMDLQDTAARERELAVFLEAHGFAYGSRSAENLFLIHSRFPPEVLHRIAVNSLFTASPDMALNALERLCNVIPPEMMLELCRRRKRLSQFVNLCGSSPFLINLMFKEPRNFRLLFIEDLIDTARSFPEMLSLLREKVTAETDFPSLQKLLREFKRFEILRIAARDLNGLSPLEEVTLELSNLAAASLQIAYEVCRTCLEKEHGAPMMETASGTRPADMTVIGMGKFGGRELNFSSDIDIIYFYEADRGETAGREDQNGSRKGVVSLHTFFNRLAEMINKAISQVTEDGFVFRVDVGLRPEGKAGDMAVSMRAAEIYYESWGQSWERSAMLKARPVAGSLDLGSRLLQSLHPFVYRKYLDYNLIEDMKTMKQKIDASLARSKEGETNLKLGRGGIREIEFFIQALQLVYAGRNSSLRERNSLMALKTLESARLISEEDCRQLSDAYRFLRTVEHRIQVVQERQTHNLPTKQDEILALSRRCGFLRNDGLERFRQTLEAHRANVSGIYSSLFHSRDEKLQQEVDPHVLFFLDTKADPDMVKDMLAEKHFADVERAYDNLLSLRRGPERVKLTERSRRILEKISPLLLQSVFESPDPDLAFSNLDRFLSVIGTRPSCYALLAENREILKILVALFGTSEFLSKILTAHPELLESMVGRSSSSPLKKRDTMHEELTSMLAQAQDVEERLDILRRYRNEEFLRIGMDDIYGRLGQTETSTQLTLLGEVCLDAAYELARGELARFGTPRSSPENGGEPAGFAIIAMGKLGGGDLNYHSDLDIIFVYDHQGYTDGEKQISNHEYFAKLAQKIISTLSMQTREGYVYKIDTRLRPSGNAGPLVTSLSSFREYHGKDAQIWERQALTKARVVLGDRRLAGHLEEVISSTVYGSSIDDNGRQEINRLRMRMENEIAKERDGSYNIKTGRGGMVDVEFIVQFIQLREGCLHPALHTTNTLSALKEIRSAALLPEEDTDALIAGFKFLRKLENRLRIIHDYSISDLSGPAPYLNKLARRLGYDPKLKNAGQLLVRDYEEVTGKIRKCYDTILGY